MKNLLLIIPGIGPGGQERIAIDTAKMLQDIYKVTMVTFNKYENSYTPSCPIIELDLPASPHTAGKIKHALLRIKEIKRIKKELKIDLSISFGNTANIVNALSKLSDKIILSLHGYGETNPARTKKPIFKMVYRRADKIVCVSEKIAKDFSENNRINSHKVVTIHNPYDFNMIVQQSGEPIEFFIKHPAIVSMGRLEKVKGYTHLLRAVQIVHSVLPQLTLYIIGEGSKLDELMALAENLMLAECVIFTGYKENPYKYLSKSDVYVLSSIHEGFPNALVEAMACGLPAIATDCKSGPREILTEHFIDSETSDIEYGDFGILVPPFTSDENPDTAKETILAEALIKLLKDDNMRAHYQKTSRERARIFSYEAYLEKLIEVLEK